MKKTVVSILAALLLVTLAAPSWAKFVIGGTEGWELSTDGNVNLFSVYERGDDRPAGVNGGITLSNGEESFRLRSGFLPGVLAFNVKAPTLDGLDFGARVGFYPNPQNANTKNSFSNQIDLREIFFTVDGDFGQVLVGKTLSLYHGKNLLTGMSLIGTGIQGAVGGGGTTLGSIGYGYLYPQFNAQIRYATPNVGGAQFAIGLYDPSVIAGSGQAATVTKGPRWEAEALYYTELDGLSIKTWIAGLYQKAEFKANGNEVEAAGVSGGVQLGLAGAELVLSGFDGKGLGSALMLDTDSLDATGAERDSLGYLAQATYKVGATKLGVAFGANEIDETAAERAARTGTGVAELEAQRMLTFGIYHDLNKYLKLVGEYSMAENEWFGGQTQDIDLISAGAFFNW